MQDLEDQLKSYREVGEVVSLMSEAAVEIINFIKQFHLIN